MCGIVGILGNKNVSPLILKVLKRLEYRGYDSAGIATLHNGTLVRRRSVGKLDKLSELLVKNPITGLSGIGHTRWATHGAPTIVNSHPHQSGESVAVVHNGIIENFFELRLKLLSEGITFESETDTEVISQLVNSFIKNGLSPISAVEKTVPLLRGAFALCFLFSGENDLMIAVKQGSPMAVGYGENEMFVGSDAIALAILTEKISYLEEGDLSEDDIKVGIRERTLNNEIVPCLCGSAFKNKGVQTMLDAVVDFLPAPNEVKPVTGILDNDEEGSRSSDDEEPFSGIAFKIATDPFVGSLTFVRVYSGVLSTGDSVFLPIKGKKERIGRMLQMHSNKRDEISEARAGDICAVIGLKEAITGETLCDEKNKITLESMNFPEPVISVAVEPKTKEDQEKMGVALGRLAQEDPSFRLRTDEESGQTIMSGMGELHLDVLVDRMRREFGVEANVGKPQVAYRESIRKYIEEEAKFVRQSGGRGQYGHVYIKMEPLDEPDEEKDQNYQFVNEIVGGAIPREFIGAVDKGCREQMEAGVIAGYPLVKVKVTLYDGSYHDVDSSEVAFKVAGSMAFKGGAQKADPVLLEPIMSIEIVTPEEYMGDVVGDLSRRRGVVHGMEDGPSGKIVSGEVPLAEMFGYATDIRSASQGRATFTMEPLKYSEVPSNVAEAIISKND